MISKFKSLSIKYKILISFILFFPLLFFISEGIRLYGLPFLNIKGIIKTRKIEKLNQLNQIANLKKEILISNFDELINDINIFYKEYLKSNDINRINSIISNMKNKDNINTSLLSNIQYLTFYEYFLEIVKKHEMFDLIEIINPSNNLIILSTDKKRILKTADTEIINKINKNSILSVANIVKTNNNDIKITMGSYLYYFNKDNKKIFNPVIILKINPNYIFNNSLKYENELGKSGRIMLVDEENKIIKYSCIDSNVCNNYLISEINIEEKKILKHGKESNIIYYDKLKNKKIISLIKYIRFTNEWNWGLIISQDELEINKPIYKEIIFILIRNLILYIIIIIFTYLVTLSLIIPIKKLSKAAEHVSKGNFDINLPVKTYDEIGKLTDTFNKMSLRLKKWHTELENQILKRTKSLEKKKIELEKTIKEKDVLFMEINHRVKNNLIFIKSFLSIQMHKTMNIESKKILKETQNRISSIALIHTQLYKTSNISEINMNQYIKELVNELRKTYYDTSHKINFKYEISDIILSLETAIPCGIIINEIISNAFKYAFPKKKDSELKILFSKSKDQYKLIISDNGAGLKENYKKSFGIEIIEILTKQLNGKLIISSKNGTEYKLIF